MIPTSFFARRSSFIPAAAVFALGGAFAIPLQAQQVLYWDTNGSAAGSSNTGGAPGTWSIFSPVNQNWSTSAAGTGATQAWPGNGNAIAAFSAGGNATGAYEVTVHDTMYVSGLNFNLGDVTLSGYGRANDTIFPVPSNNIFPVYTAPGTTARLQYLNITPSLTSLGAEGNWTLNKTGTGTLAFDWMKAMEFGLIQCNEGTMTVNNQGTLKTTRIEVGTAGAATLGLVDTGVGEQRMTVGLQNYVLGVNPGSSGTINFSGSISGRTSRLRGDMVIGKQGAGTLNLNAGADLRAENGFGNSARLPGRFVLGLSSGSAGVMNVNSGGYCEAVGVNGISKGTGSAVVNLTGGLLNTRPDSFDVPFSTSVPVVLAGSAKINVLTGTSTFSGPISGTGSLTVSGGGTMLITGGTSYTGDTIINSGGLTVSGSGASLGIATSATSKIVANANFTVSGGAVARPTTFVQLGTGGGTGAATVTGAGSRLTAGSYIEIGSSGTGTLNVTNGGVVASTMTTALGLLAGSVGTVNVTGAGSSLTTGTTLFVGYESTGIFTVGAGGSVTAGNVNLGLLPGSSGSFILNTGGTLNVGGANGISTGTGAAGFAFAGGMLKVTGSSLTTTVPMTLTNASLIDTSGVTCTLNGTLSGPGSLSKTGGGTLYLNVPNSYSGGTTNYGGQIVIPAGNALGTGPLNVAGGNVHCTGNLAVDRAVALNGASSSLTSVGYMEIGLGGTGTLSVTSGATVTSPSSLAFGVLGGGTLGTADVSGNGSALNCSTTMYIGYLSSGGVNVGSGASVTAGSLLLAAGPASQAFFNLTAGGTLNVGGADGIAKGSGAATFNFDGGTIKVTGSSLSTGVPMTVTRNCVIDTNGADCTLAGALGGSGSVSKIGAGTLAITAANNLTGSTSVSAGTLGVATSTSLGTGALALNGGTLDLSFSGTATVLSLSFDGTPQLNGTWGSLASSAAHKSARITGTGLLNVLTSTLPPTFNPAATAGLSYAVSGGTINLATASGATPAGGTFSGPGVSGGLFDPAVAGYGLHTITYNSGGSSTFTIAVTGGLTLDETGGTMAANNLSLTGFSFAWDTFQGPHSKINDATYGNASSWSGASPQTFAGVWMGGLSPISRIAFGRDNTGAFTDRCQDYYLIQYTAGVPAFDPQNLMAAVTASTWITLGAVDYRPGSGSGITQPGRRHLFSFPPVNARAIRIICATTGTAIDELEVYSASGPFLSGGITQIQESGGIAPGNLAATGTAFAKDVFPHPSHTVPHLNDGTYGNEFSWLGLSADSFVGITLGGGTTLDRIAFGRDNTNQLTDRSLGRYTLQYTTVPAPDASTPDASWTTIGILDYQSPGDPLVNPSRRHLYAFPAVTATGIRLLTPIHAAIDELELYLAAPHLKMEQPAGSEVPANATVDFGSHYTTTSTAKTFTITNDGTSTQIISNPVVGSSDFIPGDPGSYFLAPGASTTFTLTYTAGAPGVSAALVRLPTNTTDFNFNITGTSLAPGFNAAATSGLIVEIGGGPITLSTATAATPAGGTFSGPGVSGGTFDPAIAGYGIHTLTYTVGTASSPFRINIVGGLTQLAEAGTFLPNNLAPNGIAFAYDSFLNDGPHTVPHLNDGIYGNANSWIGISDGTFAGISLGATVIPVNRIAFGRDNQGAYTDRATDYYTIQYTAAPDPESASAAWTTIGAVDYNSPGITNPALRHLFCFPTVNATGLRIITATAGMCIDEVEIYPAFTPRELWRQQYFGSTANAGDAADDFDFDHDGLTNLVEFAFGQNPTQPGSAQVPEPVNNGSTITCSFTQPAGVSGITYRAEWSADMVNWITVPNSGTFPQRTFSVPVETAARKFFRLLVLPE